MSRKQTKYCSYTTYVAVSYTHLLLLLTIRFLDTGFSADESNNGGGDITSTIAQAKIVAAEFNYWNENKESFTKTDVARNYAYTSWTSALNGSKSWTFGKINKERLRHGSGGE